MRIYESAEDYLEIILTLSKKQDIVISKDIVSETGYSKPSISIAMRKLKEKELINMDEHHQITLTEAGREVAERIYERHLNIAGFFKKLGVSEENATSDACRMEHFLSEESYEKMKDWMKNN